MTAPRHPGTPDTLPPGKWCDAAVARDGKLHYDVAFRCAGCSTMYFLFCHTVRADGVVEPDHRCHACGTTQTLTLASWDDDPC